MDFQLDRTREGFTGHAPCDGVAVELHITSGDTVESQDQLPKTRAAS